MELCKDCGVNEKHVSSTNKKYSYCKDCNSVRSKKYTKKYFKTEKGREAQKRYHATDKGRSALRKGVRNYQRRQNGFSPELFQETLAIQGHMCAICSKDIHESSHADHNHDTGNPRGILCPGCNTLLGRLESVGFDWVDSAKEYLDKYK